MEQQQIFLGQAHAKGRTQNKLKIDTLVSNMVITDFELL